MKKFLSCFFLIILMSICLSANDKDKLINRLNPEKATEDPESSVVNINNITLWVSSDGYHYWVIDNAWNVGFPNGGNTGVIFSEGIIWGGKIFDGIEPIVRLNGNMYGTGCSPLTRIFRVRPDFKTSSLLDDAARFFNLTIGGITDEHITQVRSQYEKDWNEWPAEKGAPYNDIDSNGIFNPDIDIPGIPEASQTLFIKYNDSKSHTLFGSPSMGLEVNETYWAYSETGGLGNTIFKKVNIVFTGKPGTSADAKIDSFYISQWVDPDVGFAMNDLVGCDTSLSLGYAYNHNEDYIFNQAGFSSPAVGYDILQGISTFTGKSTDSAIINFSWRKGYKYIAENYMNSFIYLGPDTEGWIEPNFEYDSIAYSYFNLLRGFLPMPPYPHSNLFPDSVADRTSGGVYLLNGDPVTQTGKIDGNYHAPGDRKFMLVNGPVSLEKGDTVEIVIALIAALSTNNLASVQLLKEYDESVQSHFDNSVNVITGLNNNSYFPEDHILYQNFPNPFNPFTTIEFFIKEREKVTLSVFNLLGEKIADLLNDELEAGIHRVLFNAELLASGVYFYKLQTKNFSSVKKLTLLK